MCHFQPTTAAGVPYCYYPPNAGYTVSQIQYTSSGLTADLGGSSPKVSPTPIDTLRLEVKYHENHMLQFKVTSSLYNKFLENGFPTFQKARFFISRKTSNFLSFGFELIRQLNLYWYQNEKKKI